MSLVSLDQIQVASATVTLSGQTLVNHIVDKTGMIAIYNTILHNLTVRDQLTQDGGKLDF